MKKKPTVAICYDFDGTLSPLYMQEYGFFLGLPRAERKTFWNRSNSAAKAEGSDPILRYMKMMIDEARYYGGTSKMTRQAFKDYGKGVKYFKGVETWFRRIKKYAASVGVSVNHYIISSGLKELVEGMSIGKFFKQIYACSFIYENDVAVWPAQVVNYTTKTQYLFRINKGEEDISSSSIVNSYIEHSARPIPFENMIYIGDGETDVPCMRVVKAQGGHSIAVFNPRKPNGKEVAEKLFREGRVNYVVPANYSENSLMEKVVKGIIKKVSAQANLDNAAISAIPSDEAQQATKRIVGKQKENAPCHSEETASPIKEESGVLHDDKSDPAPCISNAVESTIGS